MKRKFVSISNHLMVAVSAWISKVIIVLVQVVSIRVLLDYLGEDKYAVYVIAFSLTVWFNLSEFGIGASLQNFISEARAKKENYDKYIIAALQLVAILFVIVLLLAIFVSSFVQNIVFKNFLYITDIQSINIVLVIGIISIVSCFLTKVFNVYYALHKGYIANLIPAISIVVSMLVMIIINRNSQKQGSILCALLVFTLPQLFIVLVPFIKEFKKYFPKLLEFNLSILKALVVRAVKFHGIIIASLTYLQTDYLVMSQTLSPKEIVEYNIFMRVFMFFSYSYVSFLTAFWPVSAEMYVGQKFEELKTAIKKHLTYASLFMILGTVLVILFHKIIVKILVPEQNIFPTFWFMLMLGIYIILKAWQDTFAMFLQSINVLRIFWVYMPFQIIVNILVQYFLSKKYGVNGIVLGLIISMVCVSIWILFLKTRKVLKYSIKVFRETLKIYK
ncbi:MAG: MATE family efflux transporter [Endomicrobium sp.]|jgi:O-antigen/teichoic acid export membrane protein|nr:MATE family efflux transporter [Endomicrobium sp.]